MGQQVWPGDINNNGIVNNIDVLYWAVANGATGDKRTDTTSNWEAKDLPANLWDQDFPNGLNYAYADCDGDGDVDDDDKTVIENNFGQVHGEVVPDEYTPGDPATDPTMGLASDNPVVAPAGTLMVDLSLGSEDKAITDFYGIAFTVIYDPDAVGNKGNDFRLDVLADTWMSGQGDEKVIQFFQNDRDLGIAQFALVRKNGVPVSGFGDIGTFNIVIEEIFTGKSVLTASDIQMADVNLGTSPVVPSDLEFSVDSTLTATIVPIVRTGLKVYPNPVSGREITIDLENPEEGIRLVELYDVNGRLLRRLRLDGQTSRQQLPISTYPRGVYTFKVLTNKRIYVQSFVK
ncbi:MAG: T9SS type A sorting domain-containing protein [Saprospiraceae bacterium]|nr:T9SS type A sorting domain-containing protein [Lewinella sp.]